MWPTYDGRCQKKLVLPPHLEEMGDRCIIFLEEGCGEGEQSKPPKVEIPKSVTKLGKNPVVYEE